MRVASAPAIGFAPRRAVGLVSLRRGEVIPFVLRGCLGGGVGGRRRQAGVVADVWRMLIGHHGQALVPVEAGEDGVAMLAGPIEDELGEAAG